MRFSARAAGVHPRPSYGGLQEIVMLTLIEETGRMSTDIPRREAC
jgi:hypothetical protein